MNLGTISTAALGAEIAELESVLLTAEARLSGLLAELNRRIEKLTRRHVDEVTHACQLAIAVACEVFDEQPEAILGAGKTRRLVDCRHAAMLLAREALPEAALDELKEQFQRNCHGGIIQALRSVQDHIDTDAAYAARVATARARFHERLAIVDAAPPPDSAPQGASVAQAASCLPAA